jgi:hypothetical protein
MKDQNEVVSSSEELVAFEQEKMSRRRALGRLGFLAGAAAVAALTSDELLRKVGDKLAQNAGDNKVAQQVAKEFQAAGVALASPSGNPCSGCSTGCTANVGFTCEACAQSCGIGSKKWVPKQCYSDPSTCNTCCQAQYVVCGTSCNKFAGTSQFASCMIQCNLALKECSKSCPV